MTTEKIAMHWINGEWVDSNPHRESIDPATYQVIGSYADHRFRVGLRTRNGNSCDPSDAEWAVRQISQLDYHSRTPWRRSASHVAAP